MSVKVLHLGAQKRYETYDPHTPFSDAAEKIYLPMDTPLAQLLGQEALPEEEMLAGMDKGADAATWLDADFILADAVAKVPGELIRAMPHLKMIHSEGVAFNSFDWEEAARLGVYVCNCRGANKAAVAEQAILLMLACLRNAGEGDRAVREGRQIKVKERMMVEGFAELGDCTVGLVGFGAIAKETAKRLAAFGCKVVYYARHQASAEEESLCGAAYLPLEELLVQSDIVSLHVPVTKETTGMVDARFLEQMKETAWLINTARGEIVDNEALAAAITSGRIAGAGIDTLAPEPVQADHPLVNLPAPYCDRVFFSPHIGGVTSTMFKRAHRLIWENIEKTARGERPDNICNGL